MADFVRLKNAAIVGQSARGAKRVQADVRVACAGGDQHLSLDFWGPDWSIKTEEGDVLVDRGLLAEKEDGDLKQKAVKLGCIGIKTVEVLTL